ncbi:hypothetical protein ACW9KT_21040 [Hymenobacter sp. HD11105]
MNRKSPFFATDLTAVFAFSEFKPLRPTRNTVSQRIECFFYHLHEHIIVKEWYVWQAIILLAQTLGEPTSEVPDSFKPPVPKPAYVAGRNSSKDNTTASSFSIDPLASPVPKRMPVDNVLATLFAPLLLNYSLPDLIALLTELELLDATTKRATPAASSGAWVGIIYALLDEKRPRLRGSKAAIWRAFSKGFKAVGSERAVQNGLGTRQSEAEQFRDRALRLLNV